MSESLSQLTAEQAADLIDSLSGRVAGHISRLAVVSAGVMERQVRNPEIVARTGHMDGRVLDDGGYEADFHSQEIGRVYGLDASGFEVISATQSKGGEICAARIKTGGYMSGNWITPVRITINSSGAADGNAMYGETPPKSFAATKNPNEHIADYGRFLTSQLATAQVAANIVDLTVRSCVPSEQAADLRETIHAGADLLVECARFDLAVEVDFLGQRINLNAIHDQPFLDCVAIG